MKHITIFDKQYSDDKQYEELGVTYAFVTKACDKCAYLPKCESDDNFVFPNDAACMIKKRELKIAKGGLA